MLLIKMSVLILYITKVASNCTWLDNSVHCRGNDVDSFLRIVYSSTEGGVHERNVNVHITNAEIHSLEYFPNLPYIHSVRLLEITNCSMGHVADNALDEMEDLQILDLSYNALKNILFIRGLPEDLKEIYMSHNQIVYVDDVFKRLKKLRLLDLSSNKINIIDLKNVYIITALDFSHNQVEVLVTHPISRVEKLDLSWNLVSNFNEQYLGLKTTDLDLSHNPLQYVKLVCYIKSYLNLSGNNMTQLLDSNDCEFFVDTLNVSFSSDSIDLKGMVNNRIVLKDSNFPYLNNASLNLKSIIFHPVVVDLSNCSILSVAEYYFSYMDLLELNLSYNSLTLLENHMFAHSKIDTMDLSHSRIKTINVNTFQDAVIDELDLSHNELTLIDYIFNKSNISKLDLSFNPVQIINNHIFDESPTLIVLNLSNCLIDKIEPQGFAKRINLTILDLSFNRLEVLETRIFANLSIAHLNLTGNKIKLVQYKTFNDLQHLYQLDLSALAIMTVESEAFYNLNDTQIIDLSRNNITIIPVNMFVGLQKLRKVLLDGNRIKTMNPFSNSLQIQDLSISFQGNLTSNRLANLHLVHLDIKDSVVDIVPASSFAGLYNLKSLICELSDFGAVAPGALDDLYNLRYLDCRSLFERTQQLQTQMFRHLKSLQMLRLSSLLLESIAPNAFQGLQSLETLHLRNSKVTTLEPNTFQGLSRLKKLIASSNALQTVTKHSFAGLNELQVLSLAYNKLTNVEPKQFIYVPNLEHLDLRYNQIGALAPTAFHDLSSLLKLDLSNNYIDDLPNGVLQHLVRLEVLNLRYNRLKTINNGALSNLKSLTILDLSFNELISLEYVSAFFSLRRLERLLLDGNHLKDFDFDKLLDNLLTIRYVGISFNKWQCGNLSDIVECFNKHKVAYEPEVLVFDTDNIDGVGCIDICKYVYCFHETTEDTLHYY